MSDAAGCSWEGLAGKLNLFKAHAAAYRLLGGRLVGRNVLLLTTIGRHTGRRRSTPLFYARDGNAFLVVASNGGEDRYPGWWHNIRANPKVTVQVGTHLSECRADEVAADDAQVFWPRLLAVYGGYERYRGQTRRPLTIFRLHPLEAERLDQPATQFEPTPTDKRRNAWTV